VYLLWLTLAIGIQLLIGHAQITFFGFLGLVIYFTLRHFGPTFKITQVQLKNFSISLLLLILVGVFGLTIASLQVLPTLELTSHSWRDNGLAFEESVLSSYHPQNLATWLFPYIYGNPAENTYLYSLKDMFENFGIFWEVVTYIGLLPFLLAIITVVSLLRKKVIWARALFGLFVFWLNIRDG